MIIIPKYDFTTGTQLLFIATTLLFLSWLISIVFYPDSASVLITFVVSVISGFATYAATTDMDHSTYDRAVTGRASIRRVKLNETSAASTWSIVAIGIHTLNLFIWILVIGSNMFDIIALLLSIIGGVFLILGAIVSHREWEG